jgi:hypothetical protein
MLVPILRSQSELNTELSALLVDAGSIWTDAQRYRAINQALSTWQGRVMVPYLYTLTNGWTEDEHDFTLPDYIDGPIDPQILRNLDWPFDVTLTEERSTWVDMEGYSLEISATGGQTLRLHWPAYASDGRIKWWGHNGPVPTTLPVTSAEISSSATSVTLTTKPMIGKSGYIKIDAEWMQYAGVTEAATTLTLSNLVRGVQGTTAATHIIGSTVTWGVAMDRAGLLQQLYDQARAHLWDIKLANPGSAQAEHISALFRTYRESALMFWRSYVPGRNPKARTGRMF